MLQRLNIRGKILAVVAVPILVLLLAVGVVTINATQTLNNTRNVEQLIGVLGASRAFESDLQTERNLSVNYVDAFTGGLKKRQDAEQETNVALENLEAVVAENPTPAAQNALAEVKAAINLTAPDVFLEDLRSLDVTSDGVGEWVTYPSEEDTQAAVDAYTAIADTIDGTKLSVQVDAVNESESADAALISALSTLSVRIAFEGLSTQNYLVDPAVIQTELIAALPKTDAAAARYDDAVEGISDRIENQSVLITVSEAELQTAQLPNVRTQVVNRSVSVVVLNGFYSDTIEPLVKLSSDVASVASDRTLAGELRAYNAMDILVERVLSEEVYTEHLLRAGFFLPGDSTFQRSLVALSDIAIDNAQATVDPLGTVGQVPPFGASASTTSGDSSSFQSIRTNISSGLDASLITERANDWPLQVSEELGVQIPIRDTLWSDAQSNSAAAVQSTLLQTILTIVGAVLVVFLTIFIALLIARRIIGPLRRLTTTATAVRQELPRMVERLAIPGETVDVSEVQIPIESTDEIGRLAEAFNGVNAATLSIAGEQAALRGSISEMFVNVARRDQVLLNRQLASIDEMERTEEDPHTLTRLFALDHLATRMRRNSESLLVLAGIDTGRRLRRPMPLADVIRTASSEIELYERVQLELDADPAMVGHSALIAAHLFAELLENATVFSDPGSPVVVRTFEADGDFIVEVIDTGIGMTVDELREANNRVASTAASEILGAQRLGLFVVGRIARRVGASVAITSREGAGTTATVTMPPSLFDARSQEPLAHVSGNASDTALHAPAALVSHNVADEIIDDANEPDATKRPGVPAYQPSAVESGASLAGRAADAPQDEVASLEASAAQSAGPSVDDLIAADAAAAPEADAVDTASLSGGVTASGLPARRRRASSSTTPTSDEERAKIIGLPARATADQLSALDAEAPGGFQPAVSAQEIAPQTAEERASMFRGFRSRKDSEQDMSEAVDPEAESMGQAARRGAFGSFGVPEVAASGESDPLTDFPMLEEEDPADSAKRAAAFRPSFAMPKVESDDAAAKRAAGEAGLPAAFGARDNDPYEDNSIGINAEAAALAAGSEPLTIPQFEEEVADRATATHPNFEDQDMVVPSLEEDDEPVDAPRWGPPPSVPEHSGDVQQEAPQYDEAAQPGAVPSYEESPVQQYPGPEYEAPQYATQQEAPAPQSPAYGVEQVSLETGPTFAATYEAPPAPTGEPISEGVDPAPFGQADTPAPEAPAPAVHATPAQTPAPTMDPAELAALTATPSMDELMAGTDDDKPNFFSRLFGRGKKSTDPSEVTAASAPDAPAPFAPATEAANHAAPSPHADAMRGFAPAAPEPQVAPIVEAAPAFAPEIQEPAPGEFAPVDYSPALTPQEAPSDPVAPLSFAPTVDSPHEPAVQPQQDTSWNAPQAPEADPVPAPTPAPASAAAASFFAPRSDGAASQAEFSPDELASPMGWEAAGASALREAQPEVQTSYSPTVDLDSQYDGGSDLSSVFGEFSSLSAERPKVEKTRAGLQKRRAADAPPVEVTPIEEEVVVAPRERNAEDVRSRFSSFYSGTARARSDAAEFEKAQATTDANE